MVSRIEASGSSPCLRLCRRQMDEKLFSSGTSSSWRRNDFLADTPLRRGSPARGKGSPSIGQRCTSPRGKGYPSIGSMAPIPRNRGTRRSEEWACVPRNRVCVTRITAPFRRQCPPALGEGVPVRRNWGTCPSETGYKVPRKWRPRPSGEGTRSSVIGYTSLGKGSAVQRKR